MTTGNMHANEFHTDAALVRRLVAQQFPPWAELPIERVVSTGTDNAMYRLGDAMVARLPRIPDASLQVEKEHRWLPWLAEEHLPLEIPSLLGQGLPAHGYPWHWSVYSWLEGDDATATPVADLEAAGVTLAGFIAALQAVDATDGPPPGDHNFWRGEHLADRADQVFGVLRELDGEIDTGAARAAWEAALAVPRWEGPPVWIHGDLYAGNLLVRDGRLSAVIDFGGLGVGDPACDISAAWTFLSPGTRGAFRAALPTDDATWARGRGWALAVALVGLPYYRDTNPVWANIARRTIADVLADG